MYEYFKNIKYSKKKLTHCALLIALAWVSFFIGLDRHVYPAMYFSLISSSIYLFFLYKKQGLSKTIVFPLLPIIALCICTSISWLTGNGKGDFRYAWMWLSMALLGLAAGSAFPRKTWLPMMFLPLSLTASFLVYACIGKIVPGENLRLLTHGPNVLGMLAGYSILIYLGNLNDMTRKQKWLFFPPAILIPSILMVLSGSRGAFIALAASVFLCACMYRAWKTILASVVILMAGMLFLSTTPTENYQINRLKNGILHPLQQKSFHSRRALWEATWAGIQTRPVLGCQMSSFRDFFHDYREKNYTNLLQRYTQVDSAEMYHPHNLYLGILFGWGCIGGIAFIITTGATLRIAKKDAFIFPLIILFYNAIFGISGFNLHRKDGAYTFFLIYGLTIGRYYLAKKVQYESTS